MVVTYICICKGAAVQYCIVNSHTKASLLTCLLQGTMDTGAAGVTGVSLSQVGAQTVVKYLAIPLQPPLLTGRLHSGCSLLDLMGYH